MSHGACVGEESRNTKPCVFPCEVAAGGDGRYLVCAAGAAAIVSMRNQVSLGVLPRVVVDVCYKVFLESVLAAFRSQCNGCMMVVSFVAMCVETCGLDT